MKEDSRKGLSLIPRIYEMKVEPFLMPQISDSQGYELLPSVSEHAQLQLKNAAAKIKQLEQRLLREEEFSYILKNYFHKIQKLVYNQPTQTFDAPLNYQALELHLRQILRRLQDVENYRLQAPPKIYRKSNVKVYKVVKVEKEDK